MYSKMVHSDEDNAKQRYLSSIAILPYPLVHFLSPDIIEYFLCDRRVDVKHIHYHRIDVVISICKWLLLLVP